MTYPDNGDLVAAAAIMARGKTVVLTGAGISTDSGIPDYRGEGAPHRTPMTIHQFLGSHAARQRYWAGSHLGWRRFAAASPNPGHRTLAELEADGFLTGVITQNVDELHTQAGTRRQVELHGSVTQVLCLTCGQAFARQSISARIEATNPWLREPDAVVIAPDGDAEVAAVADFVVPVCTVCGGMLKPDVVFFGEFVPTQRFIEATALVSQADAMLIAGSSLVVNSGIRLLEQARRRRMPVIIINRGVTKGDDRATIKLDTGTSQALKALAELVHTHGDRREVT